MSALEKFEIYRNFRQNNNNILLIEKRNFDFYVLFDTILIKTEEITTPWNR